METKSLWIRLGITVQITPKEEAAIFSGTEQSMAEAIRQILSEGRFYLNGDTYVPAPTVETFNQENNTSYELCDYECSL